MTEFIGAVPALAQALTKRGYEALTPVQEAILAPELTSADILVSAQTGSGKTVAFGMSMAPDLLGDSDRFARAPAPLALVVAPTRELALQVKRELEWLFEFTGAAVASCVGGMNMRDERRALDRKPHIVVGTPGRLRDHIERGSFDTSGLKVVVLDEADQMLDLGFRDDLEHILDAAPSERRTLMFSATVKRSIETLAKRYQRNAVRVTTTAEQSQHVDIEYRALTVAPNDVENAIVNVLRFYDAKNALVFCSTRAAVNRMTSRFNNRGFSVVSLSGELSQNERTHALQALRDGRAQVCVATDVAARGLDLPNSDLVIHAEIPKNRETLLHRSGRTGRAGRKGVCTLIVPHNWRKRTERLLESAKIDAIWAKPPSADDVMARDHERLLSDPALSAPLTETEQAFAQEILARHSAEHIAAAFIRQHFAEQAAPEELTDTGPVQSRPRSHEAFNNSVWFSLSVGRNQSAEARWLLPTICRAGHITKNDVGAIRVQPDETFVEITEHAADLFLEALGPSAKLEKTIAVVRLDDAPDLPQETRAPRRDARDSNRAERGPRPERKGQRNQGDRKARSDRDNHDTRDGGEATTEQPRSKKKGYPKNKPLTHVKPKPKRKPTKDDGAGSDSRKPWDKLAKKSKNKKSNKGKKAKKYQANLAKARSQDGGGHAGGNTPLRRKKPKAD